MSDNRIYKSESSYRFGDTLNVVTKDLAVTLRTTPLDTEARRQTTIVPNKPRLQ